MEYMSPEQDSGQRSGSTLRPLCARSDLVRDADGQTTLFRRQRSGQPHQADAGAAIQSRISTIRFPGVERGLSKCLERDLDERYQSASAILADLNTWKDKRAAGTIRLMPPLNRWADCSLAAHTGIVTALALAITGFLLRGKLFAPSAKTPTARRRSRWPFCLFATRPAIPVSIGWGRVLPIC